MVLNTRRNIRGSRNVSGEFLFLYVQEFHIDPPAARVEVRHRHKNGRFIPNLRDVLHFPDASPMINLNHRGLLADCCRPSQYVPPDHSKHIGNIEPIFIHRCIADNHNISPIVADLSQTWYEAQSSLMSRNTVVN